MKDNQPLGNDIFEHYKKKSGGLNREILSFSGLTRESSVFSTRVFLDAPIEPEHDDNGLLI